HHEGQPRVRGDRHQVSRTVGTRASLDRVIRRDLCGDHSPRSNTTPDKVNRYPLHSGRGNAEPTATGQREPYVTGHRVAHAGVEDAAQQASGRYSEPA